MRVFLVSPRSVAGESPRSSGFYRRRTLFGQRLDSVVRIRRHDAIKHGASEQFPKCMDGTGNLDMKRDLVSQAVYPAGQGQTTAFQDNKIF